MLDSYTISDIKQLKALSHACRVKILSCLTEKPMTAKQLADAFGEEPAKTSYHVKQLLKVGLVELKYTKQTQNGITEKYYQAVAREFQTDPGLARHPEGRSHLETGLLRELKQAQDEFLQAYSSKESATGHGLRRLNISQEQMPAFLEELNQLLDRYEGKDGSYTFHFLAYPAAPK